MLNDIKHKDDVVLMVDSFYDKVNQDDLIGPIFNEVAQIDWDSHLPIMYAFWSSILLGDGAYSGRPFPKHLALPIGAEHFERWLLLFYQTVDELFKGEKADEAKLRALNIAKIFQFKIQTLKGEL